jgi:hypothetical protein
MTYYRATENYGAMLQCYALQRFLRNAGHDAYIICYDFGEHEIKKTLSSIIKIVNLYRIVRYIRYRYLKAKRVNRNFFEFRDKYIVLSEKIYRSWHELRDEPPDADVYICGSDQIWNYPDNFIHRANIIHAFFLDFGPRIVRRIAYAPSFSRNKCSEEFINYIRPLLARFDFVSVREPSGIAICKQAGYENPQCMLDPCFLLSSTDYLNLVNQNHRVNISERYIFLYILRNETIVPMNEVYNYAKEQNLKIKYVTNQSKKLTECELLTPTIEEWIYLLKNAECVITNSFHGTIFSLLFEKKFIILPLMGRKYYTNMNERVEHILNIFNQKMRFRNSNIAEILDMDTPKIDEGILQKNKSRLLELLDNLNKN